MEACKERLTCEKTQPEKEDEEQKFYPEGERK
jgi:hypothetical protein